MPAQYLNADFLAGLDSLKPARGSVGYFDTEIKGFLLEHRASGGGTFYFRYRDDAGKIRLQRIGRLGSITVQDARVQAHALRKMVDEGGDPKAQLHKLRDVPLFSDFVRLRYLPYVQIKKRSWKTDETILRRHLLPVFGAMRLNRIARADVVALQQRASAAGYAAATCNRMIVLLKFICNCAIRWEVLPAGSNPCDGLVCLPDHGARERFLSHEELARLMRAINDCANVQIGQVIRLLICTGARKSEILRARWEDIDWQRQCLTVPALRSKSGKVHHIVLSDTAVQLLRSLPRYDDIPWVFFNPKTGRPPVAIFNGWDAIRQRAGLPGVRLHDLRHSFASFLVSAGRSLYEVQKLLGHHHPKMTMRYAHLAPQTMLEAVNVVGGVVAAANAAHSGGVLMGAGLRM